MPENQETEKHRVVLIVEDEPIVSLVASDILTDAGFEVIEVATADDAVALLDVRDDIDALFTDVHTPGSVDGIELARMAPDRWPLLKVAVTSGRARPEIGDLPEGTLFVPKPYRADDLASSVQSLLSDGNPS